MFQVRQVGRTHVYRLDQNHIGLGKNRCQSLLLPPLRKGSWIYKFELMVAAESDRARL